VKQRVYFFRCGITTDMSFISRRTRSFPVAAAPTVLLAPFAPFWAGRTEMPSSSRRFFEAGSGDP